MTHKLRLLSVTGSNECTYIRIVRPASNSHYDIAGLQLSLK